MFLAKDEWKSLMKKKELMIKPFKGSSLDCCFYRLHFNGKVKAVGKKRSVKGKEVFIEPLGSALLGIEERISLPAYSTAFLKANIPALIVSGEPTEGWVGIFNISGETVHIKRGDAIAKLYIALLTSEAKR